MALLIWLAAGLLLAGSSAGAGSWELGVLVPFTCLCTGLLLLPHRVTERASKGEGRSPFLLRPSLRRYQGLLLQILVTVAGVCASPTALPGRLYLLREE